MIGQIGLLTTMGLAAKNAILMIEFAEQAERRGARVIDAAPLREILLRAQRRRPEAQEVSVERERRVQDERETRTNLLRNPNRRCTQIQAEKCSSPNGSSWCKQDP